MKYTIGVDYLPEDLVPGAGEVVEMRKVKEGKESLPPYNMVGNGLANRHGESVDILEICLALNTAEMRVLQFFRTQFTMNMIHKVDNPNVVTPTDSDSFDKYLKTALMKNYMHLEYVGALRRVQRGTYILNPKVFVPSRNYMQMLMMWNKAAKEE